MPYSTVAQVRVVLDGFVETPSDPDVTPSELSDAQIGYEISNADEHINAVLRRRYTLPLPLPVPLILQNLSIDIAASQSDLIFRGSREYASILHPARLRYARALLILDHIATGDYPLYNVGEGPEIDSEAGSIVINPYKGDILLTKEVFPRGYMPNGEAEYAETEFIPYYPYLRSGS